MVPDDDGKDLETTHAVHPDKKGIFTMATMSSDSERGITAGAGKPAALHMPSLLVSQLSQNPHRMWVPRHGGANQQQATSTETKKKTKKTNLERVHAVQDKKGIFTMTTMSNSDSERGITSGNPYPSDPSAPPSTMTSSDNARSLDGRRQATSEFSAGAMSDIDRLAHRRSDVLIFFIFLFWVVCYLLLLLLFWRQDI